MAQMPKEVRDILDDPHYLGVAPPQKPVVPGESVIAVACFELSRVIDT